MFKRVFVIVCSVVVFALASTAFALQSVFYGSTVIVQCGDKQFEGVVVSNESGYYLVDFMGGSATYTMAQMVNAMAAEASCDGAWHRDIRRSSTRASENGIIAVVVEL